MHNDDVDEAVARQALTAYDFSPHTQLRMLNLSENATFLLEDPTDGRDGVLRVHREDYHSATAIESELSWLNAVRTDTGISTPVVIPARDGTRVTTIQHEARERHVVLFEKIAGAEPDEDKIGTADFHTLGGLTARLHLHAQRWKAPEAFDRFSWDFEHTLGPTPRWGRWQDGIGIGAHEVELLTSAVDLIHQRLEDYGSNPDRFGLVHADLRLANLLVEDDVISVIDFDDCGYSWFLYDFGTAVSFIEDDPHLASWQAAWVTGYREVGDLSSTDEQMLSTFVMLRRMLLVAWMGSHSHSRECQVKGPSYARGTCELAERYLSSNGTKL